VSNDPIMPQSAATDDGGTSRRWFLGAAAAVTAGGVLAACGNNDSKTDTGAGTTVTTAGGAATTATTAGSGAGDLTVAGLAAGLEVLAVATYGDALKAATAGQLGTVPDAVKTFATTAKAHHEMALKTWNGVLTGAGQKEVTTAPAALKASIDKDFAAVKDATGVAKLALKLEQTAADTYLSATRTLTGDAALTTAGALQSVDQEHAAILLFVLGMYPVPDVFQTTENEFKG